MAVSPLLNPRLLRAVLLGGVLLGATPPGPHGLAQEPSESSRAESEPAIPAGPSAESAVAVHTLLYARPLSLATPYASVWSSDEISVQEGYILVLKVDSTYAHPRQTEMPVLYVGPRPAEIANGDNDAGIVIALAPGPIALEAAPIFYGSVELPERVDGARGAAELAAARVLGIEPPGAETIAAALTAGGDTLSARDLDEVYRSLAEVLATYSPGEVDLIASYRLIP